MNKQELIDKAVESWSGIFKPQYDYVTMYGESGVYNASTNRYSDWIFNIHEFEQRARELGWVNGYKYGVEYPTNGKKPELPDDVLVDFRCDGDRWLSPSQVKNIFWQRNDYFKIVDGRYKPKSKPAPEQSWFERGELPPVGIECEYKPVNDWVKCVPLFIGNHKAVLKVQEFEICIDIKSVKFRPTKSEREMQKPIHRKV